MNAAYFMRWPSRFVSPNAKVSDGSQPPMTLDLSLSETAGSRSLHRRVEHGGGPTPFQSPFRIPAPVVISPPRSLHSFFC